VAVLLPWPGSRPALLSLSQVLVRPPVSVVSCQRRLGHLEPRVKHIRVVISGYPSSVPFIGLQHRGFGWCDYDSIEK
jgi:hypothetical protein